MRALVLLVGDGPDITGVADRLRDTGLEVQEGPTAQAAFRSLVHARPTLVLCDDPLPDGSALDVLRRLRRTAELRDLPFILLSPSADEIDRVIAFELGADDYVVKPFSARELALRVRAVLRRFRSSQAQDASYLSIGPLEIDVPRHVALLEGRPLDLTALEFRLLLELASRRGRVQRRDELLQRVWRIGPEQETRTVDTHVKRLREKLGDHGEIIETVRGVGYRLRDAS